MIDLPAPFESIPLGTNVLDQWDAHNAPRVYLLLYCADLPSWIPAAVLHQVTTTMLSKPHIMCILYITKHTLKYIIMYIFK